MRELLDAILSGNLAEANALLESKITEIAKDKAASLKMGIIEEMFDENDFVFEEVEELDEVKNVQRMGRVKLIRARVRNGKIQRRKKFAAVKGYTLRGGRVIRMTPAERMHRKRGARKAKIKRRGKLRQALRKRKISLRKRRMLGL